jgi:hypothetical protein
VVVVAALVLLVVVAVAAPVLVLVVAVVASALFVVAVVVPALLVVVVVAVVAPALVLVVVAVVVPALVVVVDLAVVAPVLVVVVVAVATPALFVVAVVASALASDRTHGKVASSSVSSRHGVPPLHLAAIHPHPTTQPSAIVAATKVAAACPAGRAREGGRAAAAAALVGTEPRGQGNGKISSKWQHMLQCHHSHCHLPRG